MKMSCHCMKLETVVKRNHEIDASDLDGEKVMMDLEKGHYFMLNGVGSDIWDLIENPISIKMIIEELMKQYEVGYEECEKEVKDFLHNLHHANLVMIHA